MAIKYVCEIGCPNVVEDQPGTCSTCGSNLIPKEESEIPQEWLNPTPNPDPVALVIPTIPTASIPELPNITSVNISEGSNSVIFLPGEYTIGRAHNSDFIVADDAVSRSHLVLCITPEDISLTVLPLASNRFITVNGTFIKEPTEPIELPIGTSEVKFGEGTTLIITTTTA
jgi:hypothetical protein